MVFLAVAPFALKSFGEYLYTFLNCNENAVDYCSQGFLLHY